MGTFSDHIVRMHESKDRSFFPEKFGNEMYHSQSESNEEFEYRSVFSIKYVVSGYEEYLVGDQHFRIDAGNYLVVNAEQNVRTIRSRSEAISIFITQDVVDDTLSNMLHSETELLDAPSLRQQPIGFFEHTYDLNSDLGHSLQRLYCNARSDKNVLIDPSFFYSLAEDLIVQQNKVSRQIETIDRQQLATRQELYRRVSKAQSMIIETDDGFNLEQLAKDVALSRYQLIRTYKQIFQSTPYRDFLKAKIAKATELLKSGLTISEIAVKLGFNDIFSFSRAFKRAKGVSPSEYRSKWL